jgi:hypothetical protein
MYQFVTAKIITSAAFQLIAGGNSAARMTFQQSSDGANVVLTSAASPLVGPPVSTGEWYSFDMGLVTGPDDWIKRTGTAQIDGEAGDFDFSNTTVRLGGDTSNGLRGMIAEWVIFKGELTSDSLTRLRANAAAFYSTE